MRSGTIPFLVAALTLAAGCVTPSSVPVTDADTPLPLELFDLEPGHDHADPALHPARAVGVTEVNAIRLADDGSVIGRMVKAGDVVIATLVKGTVGFAVVDASDPDAPELKGTYRSEYGASEGEAVAVSPDGSTVFLGVETTYSNPPVPPAVEVVDVTDPANPTLVTRVQVATQPHVLTFFEDGARGVLAVASYQLSIAAAGALPPSSAVSAGVDFHAFDGRTLTPLAAYRFDPREETPEPFFTHDPVAVEHPVTGERLLYLAAFGGGGRILNVDDPTSPQEVGHTKEVVEGAVLRHHTFRPGPALLDDGVLPTAAIPRSRAADGDAHLHFYDTSDPAAPRLLGAWTHPQPFEPGDAPPMNMHVPWFTEGGEYVLLPHFHAGLYVFPAGTVEDLVNPEPVAYWTPGAGDARGEGTVSVVSMAVAHEGRVLAADAASATLHVLTIDA